MEKQRLIWRPNSFSPEEWERLSRAEQIAWWKSREPQKPPQLGPLDHLASFQRGAITDLELQGSVFESLTEQNVADLDRYPEDLLQTIAARAAELPADDDEDGWAQMISIFGGCYAPWVTAEDIRRAQDSRSRCFRDGVRVYRSHQRKAGGEERGP